MTASPLLRCENLSKQYGAFPAIQSMNLQLHKGRIIGLLGPNGSGKTTLLKMIAGVLTPTGGRLFIDDIPVGVESKKIVSYLPDRTYLNHWMKVRDIIGMFQDFYADFDAACALDMLARLQINPADTLKTMSKGTREKVQLILVMSRKARLFLLDEPIGGVDPAARDYILNTIISNYQPESSVVISTHLIADIEPVLDDIVMIQKGVLRGVGSSDDIRQQYGMSVDQYFREVFKC